ncbi:voltage-gated hydrogen channel 1-like [Lethenteron reissneri]|uniref:voltage-gated hydrogen channel 1-like n=1 Tax=Lethenteron reissneri TaxID=7753 RepID=UPI002AB7C200|nr:voltage-gated hydrogen channel 1-like [Lethenteron reissneri]
MHIFQIASVEELEMKTEDEDEDVIQVLSPAKGDELQGPPGYRDSLKSLLSTSTFQVLVVILVLLEALFVLAELLLDLSIITFPQADVVHEVFNFLSLAVLTFFVLERLAHVFAFGIVAFTRSRLEVFDTFVVCLSFVLDIAYASRRDAFDAAGLLVLLRLWRLARVLNGIVMSVKIQAQRKVRKLKKENAALEDKVTQLKEQCAKQASRGSHWQRRSWPGSRRNSINRRRRV